MIKLIIIVSSSNKDLCWFAIDEKNSILDFQHKDLLENIPLVYKKPDVLCYLLINNPKVQFHEVSFPKKMSLSEIKQAVPNMLEEQLIDDIDEINFATATMLQDFSVPVAVISKEYLQFWMDKFTEHQISIKEIQALSLAIPLVDNRWQLILHDSMYTLRYSEYKGFSVSSANIVTLLKKLIIDSTFSQEIDFYYQANDDISSIKSLNIVTCKINYHETTRSDIEPCLLYSIVDLESLPKFSLLQNEFKPKDLFFTSKKRLVISAVSTFALGVLIIFTSLIGKYYILKKENNKQLNLIEDIYYEIYPKASSVISPRIRVSSEMSKLDRQKSNSLFLPILSSISQSFLEYPLVRLNAFEFRDNAFYLKVEANKSSDLDKIVKQMQGLKIKVQQQQTVKQKDLIQSVLVVKK